MRAESLSALLAGKLRASLASARKLGGRVWRGGSWPAAVRTLERLRHMLHRAGSGRQTGSSGVPSRRDADRRPSSLVNHILTVQLTLTAAIGLFALAQLYWTTQSAVDEHLSRWATQWTTQLNELGAPLYLNDVNSAIYDVERFVATYPEVEFITWYDADGRPIDTATQRENGEVNSGPLAPDLVERLRAQAGSGSAQILDRSRHRSGRYQLVGPIWSESIASGDLLALDGGRDPPTQVQVLGFVTLGLDYAWYQHQLVFRLAVGSAMLLLALAVSWIYGRRKFRRALQPLSQLQQPLSELAEGKMDVRFQPSPHDEIQNIITTLEGTAFALAERDQRLSHLANHDSLTGLHNRLAFVQELREELDVLRRTEGQSAVLFIDLDQFKYINDTCGHTAGDELLRMAAHSIKSTLRSKDTVARLGGDEFTVLARSVTRQQAKDIAHKIVRQMGLLTHIHEHNVFHLQCSIGIAMVSPSVLAAEEFVSQADIACHAAKENGRNRVELYRVSNKDEQQMAREVGWIQRVRRALEQDAFVLLYQPLVRLDTGWTEHYEVLLRLTADDGSLVPPDAFLPPATRFGLMVDIDYWVLEQSLKSLADQRRIGNDLCFSINLSALALDNDRFARRVATLLARYDIPAEAVIFEITEQTAVRFAARSDKQISELRGFGCRFAIDDFGKGYSSFSYLRQLPVDYLKIDAVFVDRLDEDRMNQTIVRAIGEIARAAGLETIAEGVQSAESLGLLTELGIDYAQGFFIAPPARAPVEVSLAVDVEDDLQAQLVNRQ